MGKPKVILREMGYYPTKKVENFPKVIERAIVISQK